jgi:hypothetical protein
MNDNNTMNDIVLLDITKITNIRKYDEWIAEQKRLKSLEYYYENRNELLENRKKKIKCVCGKIVSIGSMPAHKNTKCHMRYMKSLSGHDMFCCCSECN